MAQNIQFSRKPSMMSILIAIAMGMGGELHVRFMFLGTIAMLDLFSYFFALPILMANWNKMGRHMQLSLKWAFAWTGASMLANWLGFINTWYWFKCVALACSSWAIMAVAYIVLRKNAMLYLWYLVGAGIGGWIALYHFRNGAYEYFAQQGAIENVGSSIEFLIEKQIYPSILRGIFLGIILSCVIIFDRMPNMAIIVLSIYFAFFLLRHGGSRAGFGFFMGTAVVGFAISYLKSNVQRLQKRPFMVAFLCIISLAFVFGIYKHMAKTGKLGMGERAKYERELGEHGVGVVNGRAGFNHAIDLAKKTLGVGSGRHNRCHSVIANSLACEGVVGFMFWVFFYWQCFWFLRYRLPFSRKYSMFIFFLMLWACWDVFGSPFGTRYKFFVLMSFIALCQDNPMYGALDVFAELPTPLMPPMRRKLQ